MLYHGVRLDNVTGLSKRNRTLLLQNQKFIPL